MPPAISGSAGINPTDTDRLIDWLVRRGLAGLAEPELLPLFCEKCNAAGLPINRALMFMDTLHPVHEGRIFFWRNDSWTNPLSSGDAARNPGLIAGAVPNTNALPDGVRLVLLLPPGRAINGRLQRDWVRPTLSGARS